MRVSGALGLATTMLFGLPLLGCHQGVTEILCEHEAHRVCDFYFDCCMPQERADLLSEPLEGVLEHFQGELTRYRCLDAVLIDCMNESFELRAAAEEGTVDIDEAALEACNSPFEEVAEQCNYAEFRKLTRAAPTTCGEEAVLEGTIADGQPCYHSYECAGEGAECEHDNPDILTGTCVPGQAALQEGAVCERAGQCAPALYCDFSTDEATCVAKLEDGEACTSDGQCVSGICGEETGVCEAEPTETVPYCQGT